VIEIMALPFKLGGQSTVQNDSADSREQRIEM
jgi:hypothetical protein